jgi:hypothetical protein
LSNYSKIRKDCSRSKYASGGRVASSRQGAKTVINVMTPPPVSGMPTAPALPAPPAAPPSPAGPPPAGPVPPEAAAMALNQMQGKPGGPGGFKRGGRVVGGAASGIGRLAHNRKRG